MNQPINQQAQESKEEGDETTPIGAITITTILAVIILVLWFGMYMLNIARS
jgi:hypothetical protein